MILENFVHRILLNIVNPRFISMTPHHLFGSPRSPLLGTGTTFPSYHLAKSTIPRQYARKKTWRMVRFAVFMALNASDGTAFSPDAFPLVIFVIVFLNRLTRLVCLIHSSCFAVQFHSTPTRLLDGVSGTHLRGVIPSRMNSRSLWWPWLHCAVLLAWLWGLRDDFQASSQKFNAFPCLFWCEAYLVCCLGLVHWPCSLGKCNFIRHFRLCCFQLYFKVSYVLYTLINWSDLCHYFVA